MFSTPNNVTGNSSGNLMNGGLIIRYKDRYIFSDFSNHEFIASVNLDWTDKQVVHHSASRNFNLYGTCLIFCDLGDGQKIKSLNLFTNQLETLVEDNTFLLNVIENYIFYRNNTDGQKIYRFDLKTHNNIRLTDCKGWYITPVNGVIYFRNYDILKLAVIDYNGESYNVLSEDTPVDIIHDGNYLFYGNWDKGKRLTKLKIGHSAIDEEAICNDAAFSINEVGDTLYFSNWDDNKSLYSIKKDGTFRTKLIDCPVWCLNIVDQYIYFRIHGDDNSFYRTKLNSTQFEKII